MNETSTVSKTLPFDIYASEFTIGQSTREIPL